MIISTNFCTNIARQNQMKKANLNKNIAFGSVTYGAQRTEKKESILETIKRFFSSKGMEVKTDEGLTGPDMVRGFLEVSGADAPTTNKAEATIAGVFRQFTDTFVHVEVKPIELTLEQTVEEALKKAFQR